jgi:hypothetical protein
MMAADAKDSVAKHAWALFTITATALFGDSNFDARLLPWRKGNSPHFFGNRTRHRRPPTKKCFGCQVFVNIRPVHLVAIANQFIIAALLRSRVQQTRIPGERDTDRATVPQSRMQILLVEIDSFNALVCFVGQTLHSNPQQLWYSNTYVLSLPANVLEGTTQFFGKVLIAFLSHMDGSLSAGFCSKPLAQLIG